MFKHTIPSIFPLIAPTLTWRVNTTDKVLYFTFDDGPHPTITPQLLKLLNKYEAKATFFCVGDNVKKYPEIFAQIVANGHTIGNHTYHHLKGWTTTNQKYILDIEAANKIIPSTLFRPPYGRITPAQIKLLKGKYKIIMWSLLTRDYDKNLNPNKALKSLNKLAKPGEIIVFHDSEKAHKNMFVMVEGMLKNFSAKNYSFKSL
ncbi:MAG: polysaccharide deacetylase family protein [Bacteroidia bacterium]|nr:polysaccharide deacetylase family protein [Bacteroidia bacterium]